MENHQFEYLLRLGDNMLVLSQRLSYWCGKGPALEENMVLSKVALELLGQARMWLSYAGEVEGAGRNEDQLAFSRDPDQFRNFLLVEQQNGNYADTLVRQFFFDAWHCFTLKSLVSSSDTRMAAIAEKSLLAVTCHLQRSGNLMVRLGDGSDDSHHRMQAAVDDLWMYTGEMFRADEIDRALAAQGMVANPARLRKLWMAHVCEILGEATLLFPPMDAWMQHGGKRGVHSEQFGSLLAEMQFLQRAYPGAQW